jgi:hypothetical protein
MLGGVGSIAVVKDDDFVPDSVDELGSFAGSTTGSLPEMFGGLLAVATPGSARSLLVGLLAVITPFSATSLLVGDFAVCTGGDFALFVVGDFAVCTGGDLIRGFSETKNVNRKAKFLTLISFGSLIHRFGNTENFLH